MNYIILALFSAGALIPVIFILYVFVSILFKGNSQALLCMECDQCVKTCPVLKKHPDAASPKEIMAAAKVGNLIELKEKGMLQCNSCGACEKVCPRGLAPYKEVEKLNSKYLKIIKKKYKDMEIETVPIKHKS